MSGFKSLLLCASLLGSLLSFSDGIALAQPANAAIANAVQSPEQRVALVIGNSKYQSAPPLLNPDNDAQSMAQFLNSAGFEVVEATDLTHSDMIKVVQDFSSRVAARGPNAVAMIYYAGHGVQLAGENYLVPVDAKISSPSDLAANSIRLVDVMATLEAIPSRMRIVVLDACRNNPFP
ncbi:MAG: caspase family protein, partial [Alphaproteobacteria bacterium]